MWQEKSICGKKLEGYKYENLPQALCFISVKASQRSFNTLPHPPYTCPLSGCLIGVQTYFFKILFLTKIRSEPVNKSTFCSDWHLLLNWIDDLWLHKRLEKEKDLTLWLVGPIKQKIKWKINGHQYQVLSLLRWTK